MAVQRKVAAWGTAAFISLVVLGSSLHDEAPAWSDTAPGGRTNPTFPSATSTPESTTDLLNKPDPTPGVVRGPHGTIAPATGTTAP